MAPLGYLLAAVLFTVNISANLIDPFGTDFVNFCFDDRASPFLDCAEKLVEFNDTRSFLELCRIYECIRCLTDLPCKPAPLCDKFMHPDRAKSIDNSSVRAHLTSYLRFARVLMPADVFGEYHAHLIQGRFAVCYTIIQQVVSFEARYELAIKTYMLSHNSVLFDRLGCCPTHIAFFDPRTAVNECFSVARNCCEASCLAQASFITLFLPREVLCFSDWLCLSPSMDCFILDQVARCCTLHSLYEVYRAQYAAFIQYGFSWPLIRREAYLIKLKLFSFLIISVAIPSYSTGPTSAMTNNLAAHLLDMFKSDSLCIANNISLIFNLLIKKA